MPEALRDKRDSTQYRRLRRRILRTRPDCAICGAPINYEAGHLDPLAFTVDHITPVAHGGQHVAHNMQAAHRACNRAKSDRLPDDATPSTTTSKTARTTECPPGPCRQCNGTHHPRHGVTFETARTW
jgi:5-methylcytosine-specific restriction endonuclease McrA